MLAKIHWYTLCIVAGLILSTGARTGMAKNAKSPDVGASFAQSLDTAIEKAIADKRLVGTVVLVALDGKLIYHRAAGYADREAQIPMREDAIFRLSSVSKPFTSMAAAALMQQGVLRLDDPVTKWLPEFTPSLPDGGKAVITIRHLLTHTAGLEYGFFQKEGGSYLRAGVSDGLDASGISLEENLRRIASVPLLFAPGTSWNYSVATDVLGAVIAKANNSTLPQALQKLVTGPLGMKDTGFAVTDKGRLAVPYYNAVPQPLRMGAEENLSAGDGKIRLSPDRVFDATAFPSGGAGMLGTAPEVLLLLETIRKGGAPLVGADLMALMKKNQIGTKRAGPGLGFGLGWAVLVDPIEAKTPQSKGTLAWSGVYGHSWFIDPAKKLTVVMLTNTTFEGIFGQFVTDVRDGVYGGLSKNPL